MRCKKEYIRCEYRDIVDDVVSYVIKVYDRYYIVVKYGVGGAYVEFYLGVI